MSDAAVLHPDQNGKRERAKAANRQAILDAGRRVFAEMGYETATVRDIIRGTDLAAGTFYNYFKSKEEVFEALADDGARRFRPILRAVRESATDMEGFITRAIEAYFNFLVEERGRNGVPAIDRGPHVRADTPELLAVYDEVREGVKEAIARGFAPPVDPEYLAMACIGTAQEVGHVMLRRTPIDVEGAARFTATLLLRGIKGLG